MYDAKSESIYHDQDRGPGLSRYTPDDLMNRVGLKVLRRV